MGNLHGKKAESSGQEGRRVKMDIRGYVSPDCRELAELFYGTVHCVNAGDYTEEQLAAWADGRVDLEAWDRSFRRHHTLVAVVFSTEGSARRSVISWKGRSGRRVLRPTRPLRQSRFSRGAVIKR